MQKGINDLASLRPDIAKEWHPAKNHDLELEDITVKSSKRVWWRCSDGHEWATAVCNRTASTGATKCPYCSNRKVQQGINDLASLNPALASEWHPTKNRPLVPEQFRTGSEKKVWWVCENKHEWQAVIRSRNRGNGCPFCAGTFIVPGETDLQTTNPELASEWHPTKNGLGPNEVKAGSGKIVWWQCKSKHEWKAEISGRNKGRGCPFCANKKVLLGHNDLASTHPELALEWDESANKKGPEELLAGSHFQAAWKCANGHKWVARVNDRQQGHSCPLCAVTTRWEFRLKEMKDGPQSLLVQFPDLLSEWSPRNEISPGDVFAKSGLKVWWLCSKGHEWRSSIASRANGSGCPSCAVPGFKPANPGGIYLLESLDRGARKIGIANSTTKRLKAYSTDWQTIWVEQHHSGEVVRHAEAAVLFWLRVDCDLPQFLDKADMGHSGGWSETFSIEGPSNYQIIEKIAESIQIAEIRMMSSE